MEDQARIGIGVIIRKGDKILLGKRLGPLATGLWSLPGGKLDFGECVADCARRETLEETGMTLVGGCAQIGWTDNFFPDNDVKHYVTLYTAFDWNKQSGDPVAQEPEKCAEWLWLDRDLIYGLETQNLVWPATWQYILRAMAHRW